MARRTKDSDHRGIRERIADISQALDIPSDALTGGSRIELLGNRALTVESHKGILEYNDDCIRLSGGNVVIVVRGKNLNLKNLTAEYAEITGFIVGIDFTA
ncbi:YabP/YqfC family sporulation protein [Feifania hominis]|uniref:YabP/YqfC family sporulation protein n=1 Tax=Feifania hominis TaxID=2763660 RepID=A0A926DCU8_9FIRM|nr:YabP/YqfC family sporulation protein [Feifania hominis]MBC8535479.1 YabP/YqfC family sporulation protein [Feifania hominis]